MCDLMQTKRLMGHKKQGQAHPRICLFGDLVSAPRGVFPSVGGPLPWPCDDHMAPPAEQLWAQCPRLEGHFQTPSKTN